MTLVLILSVFVPSVIVLLEIAVGMVHRGARSRAHATIVFLLAALIALPLFGRLRSLPGVVVIGLALAVGAITALGYMRYALVRTFLTAASPAALVFPGVFLFASPVFGRPVWGIQCRWCSCCSTNSAARQS